MKLLHLATIPLISLSFIACGDNTDTPITPLVTSLEINSSNLEIRAMDASIQLGATVTYEDNTTADATDYVYWYNSDYNATSMLNGEIWGGGGNGGDSNVTLEYEGFTDGISVHVIALDTNSTFISSDDINVTGIFPLEVKGSYENGDTNVTLLTNVLWSATNNAIITTEDYITTVEMVDTGETNVTAYFFYDTENEYNITKTYIIE